MSIKARLVFYMCPWKNNIYLFRNLFAVHLECNDVCSKSIQTKIAHFSFINLLDKPPKVEFIQHTNLELKNKPFGFVQGKLNTI